MCVYTRIHKQRAHTLTLKEGKYQSKRKGVTGV